VRAEGGGVAIVGLVANTELERWVAVVQLRFKFVVFHHAGKGSAADEDDALIFFERDWGLREER